MNINCTITKINFLEMEPDLHLSMHPFVLLEQTEIKRELNLITQSVVAKINRSDLIAVRPNTGAIT